MKLKSFLHYLNRRDHRLLPKNLNSTKIILILFACFAVTFSVKTILAADDTGREEETTTIPALYNSEFQKQLAEKQSALEDTNINSENWIKESATTNGLLVINALVGTDTVAMTTTKSGWIPGGLIGSTNKVIASLYTPPISGVQYIADSINSFMGKSAYAANSNDGFNQLKGIQPLWKLCRNTVYTLISVVFIAMGLMIMLRIKISPQATVTIQNSIPKIITTLILVTFSYAICGLIIDLTYLVQALALSLITQTNSSLFTGNIDLPHLIKGGWDSYWSLAIKTMSNGNFSTTGWTISILAGIVGAIIGAFAMPIVGLGAILGGILGLAILLIFAFIQLIKFLFGCAKAYIILLLKIISAPLEIALGAFPNSKSGFGSWFIQTIAYASVFPICLIFLVILNVILNAVTFNQIWTPGILQGNVISTYIGGIIGLAGLIILAKLPNLIPEAIFQLKPSPFGKAVGEGFKPITAVVGKSAKGGVNAIDNKVNDGNPPTNWYQRIARGANVLTNGPTRKIK